MPFIRDAYHLINNVLRYMLMIVIKGFFAFLLLVDLELFLKFSIPFDVFCLVI